MIGVFDSGLGGLTILKALIKKLPQYDYMYFGDNANAPYGNKSHEEIYQHTEKALDFLFSHKCEIVILACNTASAEALRKIQVEYLPKKYPDQKVLGVLIPSVEEAVEAFNNKKPSLDNKRVGIIATCATVNSKKYQKEIYKLDKQAKVFSIATPLLAPIVEAGKENETKTTEILKDYLEKLKKKNINYLILGCTHYSFLQKQIQKILGKDIKIINTEKAVAEKLKSYLDKHKEIKNSLKADSKRVFYTTGDVKTFRKLGEKFLDQKIEKLKRIVDIK